MVQTSRQGVLRRATCLVSKSPDLDLTLISNSEWVVIIRLPKANAHSTHVYYIIPGHVDTYWIDTDTYCGTAIPLDMPNISKDTPSTLVSNSFGPFAGTTLECHVAPCRRCVSHTLGRRRCNAWWKYCDPRVGVFHSAEYETNTRCQKRNCSNYRRKTVVSTGMTVKLQQTSQFSGVKLQEVDFSRTKISPGATKSAPLKLTTNIHKLCKGV